VEKILNIAKEIGIPDKDIKDIYEYLGHNEWGIALEILCSTIEEHNIGITKKQYKEIEMIGKRMELNRALWNEICVL